MGDSRHVRCFERMSRMSVRVRMNVHKQGAKAILTPSPERAETLYKGTTDVL